METSEKYHRILAIDDEDCNHQYFQSALRNSRIEIISAKTLAQGREFYDKYKGEFDFILMDACVESHQPDSMPLIDYIVKDGYTQGRHIVAISSSRDYNDILMLAGATERVDGKVKAMSLLRRFLRDHYLSLVE